MKGKLSKGHLKSEHDAIVLGTGWLKRIISNQRENMIESAKDWAINNLKLSEASANQLINKFLRVFSLNTSDHLVPSLL